MPKLPYVEPGSRAHWRLVTTLVAIVFVPVGLACGVTLILLYRSGQLMRAGLSGPEIYVVWPLGLAILACFETVARRRRGQTWALMGGIAIILAVMPIAVVVIGVLILGTMLAFGDTVVASAPIAMAIFIALIIVMVYFAGPIDPSGEGR